MWPSRTTTGARWGVSGRRRARTRPAPGDTVVVTTERERSLLLGVLDTLGIQGVAVVVAPLPTESSATYLAV